MTIFVTPGVTLAIKSVAVFAVKLMVGIFGGTEDQSGGAQFEIIRTSSSQQH